jgi:predicted CXXCH cytochrome family protein
MHEHVMYQRSIEMEHVMRFESRAVKKLLLIGLGSALAFTMGGVGTAHADTTSPIHKSTAAAFGVSQQVSVGGGRCAGCHRAHTAKAEFLLKQAQPGLCYTCHGGAGSVLDVVDGVNPNNDGSGNTALRGGGFEYALINGAAASKIVTDTVPPGGHGLTVATIPVASTETAVTSRHQIDGVTTGTMWGNGAVSDAVDGTQYGKTGIKLECGSCHDPHGNGNYRILRPVPNDSAGTSEVVLTPAVAAIPAVYDTSVPPVLITAAVPAVAAVMGPAAVNIPDAITKVYTTGDYWKVADRNVPTLKGGVAPIAGATDGYITNVAQWCTTCHTRYLAGSGSYQTLLQNAAKTVTDSTFTYRHRSDRIDKDGVGRPNCIQCHVSHGTNVAMTGTAASFTAPNGLVPVPAGTGGVGANATSGPAVTAVGTSRLLRVDNRGTCEMCHNV